MQITSVTDTNYIGNPTFAVDTAGWSVAGGNLVVTNAQSFSGSTSGMFTPNSVNGYANYNVNPMSTGLPYVAQARVLAGAGQQVFIQFSGGAGSTTVVASGGWDLLTTRVVTQNVSNFDVQIGIGFELQINVIDSSVSTEQLTMGSFNYGLNHTQLFDSTVTQESYSIAIVGNMPFISDLNLSVSDNSTSSENYAIKVGAAAPFISGSLYQISVLDTVLNAEALYIKTDENTDKVIYIDNVMLEQAASAAPYFDGNSGNGYHWSGSPGQSTSYYRQYEVSNASNSAVPTYGTLISWTRALNSNYNFFTIGTSTIGGPDFIAGTSTFPTYFNQYQYGEYSTYLLGVSITKNIGQYPYGAFVAQLDMQLDNSTFLFLPGYDPTIGQFIINGRPVAFQIGFNGEMLNLFSGISTKPQNDIQNRTLSMTALDGMDYLNSFISQGAGPIASENNGNYINLPAQVIIADLLAEAGFSTSQYVFEQSLQSNIGFLCPINYQSDSGSGNSGAIGSIISDICEAEQALFFFDENGVPQFWNREHIPTNNTVAWNFAYKSIVNYQSEDTPIINDVIVTAQPRAVQAVQNIWQLTEATIIPPATTTSTITNLSINPKFVASSGGYYNSPLALTTAENVTTAEQFFIPGEVFVAYNVNENTQLSESVSIVINALNKPQAVEFASVYESLSIKVGTNPAYNLSRTLSVADTASVNETLFVKGRNLREKLIFLDSTVTSENVSVSVAGTPGKIPVQDSASTYESFSLSTVTVTGWSTQGAALYQSTIAGPTGLGNNSGQITTAGGSTSYLFQSYTCTVSTQYISQMFVKGISGVNITIAAVQNGVILQSQTVLLDGNWDLVGMQAFITNPVNTTFQIRIYSDVFTTFNVTGVLTQLGVGALNQYFDGSTGASSSYVFSWNGSPNVSTSLATPCGSATIEAGFEDDFGSLPVTSVNLPLYNNSNLDSSYLTNLNQDGSGLATNSFVSLQAAVLNGSNYALTFINTYTQPIYVTQLTLFGTPAKVVYSIQQEYKNPTSILLYGTNPANNGLPLEIDNNLIQDPSTALSNAYSLVNDYSTPYQRMTADVFPAYHLQIGDLVTATIDDTAQTLNYNIVGITNGIASDGEPLQTLEIEVKKLVHYFTINTSIIGGTDSIAP